MRVLHHAGIPSLPAIPVGKRSRPFVNLPVKVLKQSYNFTDKQLAKGMQGVSTECPIGWGGARRAAHISLHIFLYICIYIYIYIGIGLDVNGFGVIPGVTSAVVGKLIHPGKT